jgi:uncharacterized protein (TIGR02996 family)
MKRNLFLTPRGFLTSDGRRLCLLAAQPGCDRDKLAAEYRRKGYDDFSINCVFREADDRRRLIQKSNQLRQCDGRPVPPGGPPVESEDDPPAADDTIVGAMTVLWPRRAAVAADDRTRRDGLYLAAGRFLVKIADHPGDQGRRLAFAAWLEAHGLSREAAGQRWAARHGKRPVAGCGDYDYACGGWYAESDAGPESAKLPECLYRIAGAPANSSLLCYEVYFLMACGEAEWGPDGKPVGPRRDTRAVQ